MLILRGSLCPEVLGKTPAIQMRNVGGRGIRRKERHGSHVEQCYRLRLALLIIKSKSLGSRLIFV